MTTKMLVALLAPPLAGAVIAAPVTARDRAPQPPAMDLRALDANHDGKVSVREFDAAMAGARDAGRGPSDRNAPPPPQGGQRPGRDQPPGPGKAPDRDRPAGLPRGADLDTNHDGVISRAEFQRHQPRRGAPPPERR